MILRKGIGSFLILRRGSWELVDFEERGWELVDFEERELGALLILRKWGFGNVPCGRVLACCCVCVDGALFSLVAGSSVGASVSRGVG